MTSVKLTVKLDNAKLNAVLQKASYKATWSALDYLAAESKKQVPLDEGTLKGSCKVDVAPDGSEGTVSYDTPYAVRWHETDANFQRGRKKKYLEDPLNDSGVQANMMKLIQKAFHAEIGD